VAALSLALAAGAVPAKRGIFIATQPDGSTVAYRVAGDARHRYYFAPDSTLLHMSPEGTLTYARIDAAGRAVSTGVPARDGVRCAGAARLADAVAARRASKAAARVPANMLTTTFPSQGSPRALVVLVEYQDVGFTVADPKAHFEAMLSAPGYDGNGAVGSALDYFTTCSMGRFTPQFDVYGPVKLANERRYYGSNDYNGDDRRAHEMAMEACRQLDDEIDFRDYDTDGDGLIDNVYVFYAGLGEAEYPSQTTLVWPHSFDLSSLGEELVLDGVRMEHYACSNELTDSHTPAGIGTFCHEFSHVLGLPDLYTTEYNSAYTPGEWSVLDYGPYNAGGHVPPLYSAFERLSMGWIEPRPLLEPDDVELRPIAGNDACLVQTERDGEFFLFENRQQEGFDHYLPGHGMLVWHIDYKQSVWEYNAVNNTVAHQYVDIVEADGRAYDKDSRASETFPGSLGVTSLTDTTRPSMKGWTGKGQDTPLTDIAETADGLITFKVKGGRVDGIAGAEADVEQPFAVDGRELRSSVAVRVHTPAGALVGAGCSVTLPAPGIYIVTGAGRPARIAVR